jgi:hypothetical protein
MDRNRNMFLLRETTDNCISGLCDHHCKLCGHRVYHKEFGVEFKDAYVDRDLGLIHDACVELQKEDRSDFGWINRFHNHRSSHNRLPFREKK